MKPPSKNSTLEHIAPTQSGSGGESTCSICTPIPSVKLISFRFLRILIPCFSNILHFFISYTPFLHILLCVLYLPTTYLPSESFHHFLTCVILIDLHLH
mmetsp:Transcript_24621/g.38136  ORF Transcript_24621/g.38136 Transcript_24621/m.38136 type:complete len:99 (+) Transcript_24621:174-470(+)